MLTCTTIAAAVAAGCMVGPDYMRPPVPTPEAFRGDVLRTSASIADVPWWELYHDETLQGLIRTGLENNYDLRIAITRIEQARALAAQVESELYPQIGYQGGISRGRNELLGGFSPNGGETGSSALAGLTAAWEIDLWGRIRRADEAALADLLAVEEVRRGVVLTLVSDIAAAYFELLELDLRREIALRTTESFGESLRIFELRLQGGTSSKLETSRAEASLATTAAVVPNVERLAQLKENQISVLCGRVPGPIARGRKLTDQTFTPDVPPGLPSQLLERRPDIRQQEALLMAASARIGVAEAEFFPRIGLTALLGKVSPELDAFTAGSSNAWSIAANLAGPIFQGGLLTAQLQEAKAAFEEAALSYERSTLIALREVADALITREKLEAIRVEQRRAVESLIESVRVATQRYLNGKSSYYEVLEAQQQLFPAENALAETRLNQLLVIVQLYRALGGGWNLQDPSWLVPNPPVEVVGEGGSMPPDAASSGAGSGASSGPGDAATSSSAAPAGFGASRDAPSPSVGASLPADSPAPMPPAAIARPLRMPPPE